MKSFEEIYKEPHEAMNSHVWFHLLRVYRFIYPKMEKELRKHDFDSPLWHEILWEIGKFGDAGVRSTELQKILHMAQHNLSRHLSRMEKKGLIIRTPCSKDKRAHFLHVSKAGQVAYLKIWPIYFEAIQKEMGDKLSHDEAFNLFRSLTRLYE